MTYFVVESFGHGLDTRKHILNLPPGALYRAKNCNLNRGGEPESCKAFVSFGVLPPAQTFGLLSAGGKLWTFGSAAVGGQVPPGIIYQQLAHPTGTAMTAVIHATPIKGKPFVIASYLGGYGVFFNGAIIADFLPAAAASIADVVNSLVAQINASALYTASAAGNVITITGRPTIPFSISAAAINGGAVNDQSAVAATIQNASNGAGEVLAKGTVSFGGVVPIWNDGLNGGAGGWQSQTVITTCKINGVEQLPYGLVASDDAGAAGALATYCNLFAASPDYDATAAGGVTTFTAKPGTGAGPNGFAITHDSSFAASTPMAGGANPTGPVPQISTVTFGGTFEAADSYSITLAGIVYATTAIGTGVHGMQPTMALTKNSKTYAIAGPNLLGSKIGDCTEWDADPSPTVHNGTFITDMSSELAGAELLTGIGLYQNNLAIFSRSTIQMRFVDPDPANNEQLQVMQNIGTLAGKTITPFGDTDLFFLSDSGLRSLKTRQATNSATVSDIGSAIDTLVIASIQSEGANALKACASMEPVDGRFLLQIGTTTYVFNFYPDAKVSGWTTYETGLAITDFAVLEKRLFARAGDVIYLLGGQNNDQYSQQQMDIRIPYLSNRQLATLKHFTALDVVCDGVFDVMISTDPLQPNVEEILGTVTGTTLASGINPILGEDCTAVSLRFLGRAGKYARLSSIALHHQTLKENA